MRKVLVVALVLALLRAAPLPAQSVPPPVAPAPVATCGLAPPSTDQVCVGLVNAFGYTVPMAVVLTGTLQGVGAASAVAVADLDAVRARQTALEQKEIDDVLALAKRIDGIPAAQQGPPGSPGANGAMGPPGPQGIQGVPGVSVTTALPAGPNFTVPACGLATIIGYVQPAGGPAVPEEPSLDPAQPCDIGWANAGEHIIYGFYVPRAWNYRIIVSVASAAPATAPGTFHFEINGQRLCPSGQTTCSNYTAPVTGGWQTWQAVNVPLTFVPGGFVWFTVVVDTVGVNFKQFIFAAG